MFSDIICEGWDRRVRSVARSASQPDHAVIAGCSRIANQFPRYRRHRCLSVVISLFVLPNRARGVPNGIIYANATRSAGTFFHAHGLRSNEILAKRNLTENWSFCDCRVTYPFKLLYGSFDDRRFVEKLSHKSE